MKDLVVDDDPVSRMLLTNALEDLGVDFVEAGGGEEAWSLYQEHHFPVVVSDWLMPDMDGLELCRRVRTQWASGYTYYILLSSRNSKQSYLEGIEAGADDFLFKPIDEDFLQARLRVAWRILKLQKATQQMAGFISICSYCKRVRNLKDHWQELDRFLLENPDIARLSHGVCLDCIPAMERDLEC